MKKSPLFTKECWFQKSFQIGIVKTTTGQEIPEKEKTRYGGLKV